MSGGSENQVKSVLNKVAVNTQNSAVNSSVSVVSLIGTSTEPGKAAITLLSSNVVLTSDKPFQIVESSKVFMSISGGPVQEGVTYCFIDPSTGQIVFVMKCQCKFLLLLSKCGMPSNAGETLTSCFNNCSQDITGCITSYFQTAMAKGTDKNVPPVVFNPGKVFFNEAFL